MTDDILAVVAKWWGDTLRKTPRHDILGPEDRKDSTSVLGEAFINAFSSFMKPVTEEQVVAFETALVETTRAEIERMNKVVTGGIDRIILNVDYDPNRPLAEAAAKAGFDPKYRLPSKTTMFLHKDGTVEMKTGYGQPYTKFRVEGGRLVPA